MAFNIMDLVQGAMTPKNIAAIAGMLGEDEKKTTSALSGVMPALMGGLIGSFSKPEGRNTFNAAIDKADTGLLDNLVGALGGGGGTSMASSGLKMISSLFGDNKLGLLASAVSGFSGLSSGSTKSLLGVAAPLVMGMLAKKKKQDNLDGGGLIDMLTGQKDNISKAMPSNLTSQLSGSGFLDDLLGKAEAGIDSAAAGAASAARATADAVQETVPQGKSMFSKLLPAIIIALAAWALFQYFSKPKTVTTPVAQVQETVTTQVKQAGEAAMQALTVGDVNLGKELVGLLGTTGKTLSGITDVASARSALDSLGQVSHKLDSVSNLATKLSPDARQLLTGVINKQIPGLEKAISTAYAIPGVGDVLKDAVEGILHKITGLTKG